VKQYDSFEKRCPLLGHQIQFSYCRQSESGKPCSRILRCWSDSSPIQSYITEFFGSDEMQRLTNSSKNKICTIVELINKYTVEAERE